MDVHATRCLALFFEILLVVFFGHVELSCPFYLGDDRPVELMQLFKVVSRLHGSIVLLLVINENRRALLSTDVGSLPIECGGVVGRPEDLEQAVIGDLGRIVHYLDRLCMPCFACADLLIGRIGCVASHVSDGCGSYARDLSKSRFHAPETPCGKIGGFEYSFA